MTVSGPIVSRISQRVLCLRHEVQACIDFARLLGLSRVAGAEREEEGFMSLLLLSDEAFLERFIYRMVVAMVMVR